MCCKQNFFSYIGEGMSFWNRLQTVQTTFCSKDKKNKHLTTVQNSDFYFLYFKYKTLWNTLMIILQHFYCVTFSDMTWQCQISKFLNLIQSNILSIFPYLCDWKGCCLSHNILSGAHTFCICFSHTLCINRQYLWSALLKIQVVPSFLSLASVPMATNPK